MSSTKNPLHKLFNVNAKEHGDSQWYPGSNAELEVIGLGLSRTGTTSIRAALDTLGFGPVHHGVELYRRPQHNEDMIDLLKFLNQNPQESARPSAKTVKSVRSLMHGYRSTVDGPLCDMIPELLAAYPNAKFLLTLRDSEETWWRSWESTVGMHFYEKRLRYKVFRALIFPVRFMRRTDDMAQEDRIRLTNDWGSIGPHIYRMHNQRVCDLVPKDRLLEYNVKQGWGPLCAFLGVDVPDCAFPRLNEGESLKAIYFGQQVFGACVWAFYLGVLGGAVYLARKPAAARSLFKTAWDLVVTRLA